MENTTDHEKILREVPEPKSPLEILQACTGLAVGMTTLVASIKATNSRSVTVLEEQQRTRMHLARSLDLVARAIIPDRLRA